MIVTINFSESAYKSEVINNGVSIKPSVTVEFTAEQVSLFTKEQRELLVKYTEPRRGTSSFDEDFVLINPWTNTCDPDRIIKYDEYTSDVFHIINDCERKVEENKSETLAKVIEYNCKLRSQYSCGEYFVYIGYSHCHTGRGFLPYLYPDSLAAGHIRVKIYNEKLSCEDMVASLEEWNTDESIGVTRGTIIQQLQTLCVQVYEKVEAERKKEADRKAADEQRRLDEEAKKKAEKAFIEEWIQQYGSKRLKALMENGFEYDVEYRREYVAFIYGSDAHHGDEKYDGFHDFDNITTNVDCPSDDHLEKFLAFQSEHPGMVMFLVYQSEVPADNYYDESSMESVNYNEDSTVFVRVSDEHIRGNIYVEL